MTKYETVNRTDSKAHEQGQRRVQEENGMKELPAESGPPEALSDAQEREQKEGLLQRRHELKNYHFQKRPRIKKEAFKDLEVDDIDLVRIAVIGPTGSGKTSLIGTLQRALKEPQTAMVEWDSVVDREGTIVLEEHYVQKKIRLIDTRGFLVGYDQLEDELLKIVSGRIRPGDEIVRNYDKEGNQEPTTAARMPASALSNYAHAVIFVVKGDDPCLMDGTYRDKLQKIRETFCHEGYPPVTVITFLDKLHKEDKDAAFKWCPRQRDIPARQPSSLQITIHMSTTRRPSKWIEPLLTSWILLCAPRKDL
ncbi:hypothetical protein OS493_028756 [Desmophyllum pertusum]|uniref:Uncharacterized protein n=1 Tax=Desmophyllum pertusum TaxID=174260 RepID=A0A9W9YAQ0_9CNID|nr:hypothetical protein OS493_028756 [Desmophyllum pertusum]